MRYRSIRNSFVLTIAVLFALAGISPSVAGAGDKWYLRGFGVWADPDVDFRTVTDEGDEVRAETDSALGLGVSAEYRFSPRFGAELAIFRVNPDITLNYHFAVVPVSFTTSDDLTMTPITLGLNIHALPPEKRVDLYVAPLFAYIQYSDLRFEIAETFEIGGIPVPFEETIDVSVDSDVAYGVALGLDVPISFSSWAVSGTLRYLWTDLDVTEPGGGRESLGYDTLIATLGFRYAF